MRFIFPCMIFVFLTSFSFAQDELSTVISDGKGNEFIVAPDVDNVVENPTEESRTFIFTPKEGVELASAQMKKGDEITKFEGKKITYTPLNERFLIEGNAQIETETETLNGPTKIQFDPDENFMLVEGNANKWAEFHYRFPDGRVMHSYGKEFRFYFETVDGKRKLKRIEKKS